MARRKDRLIAASLSLLAFVLYYTTLLPGIGSADTAEFQRVAPTLGLAHPTGYPLYTLLGWAWSHLPIDGTPAWRMNLLSAVLSALAIGTTYLVAQAMGQWRVVAAAAALTLAASFTFWLQATIAEVYGLASLLQALLLLALLRWRVGTWGLWQAGLLLGLGLAHHRTITLMAPGAVLFVLLSRRPRPGEVGWALLALLSGCLFYLYLPLRAPDWADPWRELWRYVSGAGVASSWLDLGRLRVDGLGRLRELAAQNIWPQFLPAGAVLAILGAGRLLCRDRGLAALLLLGYGIVFAFCAAYYVNDVDVFFLPAHLVAALLLGEGGMLLLAPMQVRLQPVVAPALLALPLLLVNRNGSAIRTINARNDDLVARSIMAQPIPEHALVVVDWYASEGLRYLQAAEGQRRDLELLLTANPSEHRPYIIDQLAQNRPVFLLRPWPDLGLAQWPQGMLWQVGDRPPRIDVATPADLRWREGIVLGGYTLPPGPFRPSEIVPLTLAWKPVEIPARPYMLFVHLVGPDGTIWGQQDRPPSEAPTDQWQPGTRYLDVYGPVLDPAAPPGRYQVRIGWYDYSTMQRLQLAPADGEASTDFVTLGEIEVVPAPEQ